MTIYVVGYLKALKDADKMSAYRAVADAALAKHGGKVASVTQAPERLEGDLPTPRAIVLLAFPSAEAAKAWRSDPELASAHMLRTDGADISLFIAGEGS